MTGVHFLLLPDTVLGAGPSDRCLISPLTGRIGRCWDDLTAVGRKAVSGEVAGRLAAGTCCREPGFPFPPPLCLDPGFSTGLLSHRGVSEAPLLPLLGTTGLGTSLGLSCISAGLTLAAHLPTDLQSSL